MAKFDFIIVGAGFAGATCARLLTDKGYSCLIIEERPFVGGNCACDTQNDITVHAFGPHIFHTNNEDVWYFVKVLIQCTWGSVQSIAGLIVFLINTPTLSQKSVSSINRIYASEFLSISKSDIVPSASFSLIGASIGIGGIIK